VSPNHGHLDFGYLGIQGLLLLEVHTGLYSSRNIHTLTTLRLRGNFSPSAPTVGFYSSLIVCGVPVVTAGEVLKYNISELFIFFHHLKLLS
jgi:hypothetical protein